MRGQFTMPYGVASSRGRVAPFLALALIASLSILLLSGCNQDRTEENSEAPKGIEKRIERGPMTLNLATSAATLSTAETLTLTLSATLDDGYAVAFPDYPEPPEADGAAAIETPAFTSAGYEDAPPLLGEDGKVTRSRRYQLEPFLEGAYTIPSLPVSFWKEVEGEDQKITVDTEPLSITVTSVIEAGSAPSVMEIAGPVSVQDPVPWMRYAAILLLLAMLAGALYWYTFVRVVPGPPPPPPVPPHVRALEALEAIQREKLVEQGCYKEYYIRVSDVLRHYMEEQFSLRAPERTTEEFLAEIQHNAVLGLQEQLLLRAFLRHCDLVKFARAEPSSEEIRETFETCRKFIVDSEAAHRAAATAAAQAVVTEA